MGSRKGKDTDTVIRVKARRDVLYKGRTRERYTVERNS